MRYWPIVFFSALYDLGLAFWIGGAVVISGIVAPAQFAAHTRHKAIVIMTPILRSFARLRLAALLMILAGAGARLLEGVVRSFTEDFWNDFARRVSAGGGA